MRTVFENVDVDVRSAEGLSEIHAAVSKKAHILHFGRIGRTNHLRFCLRSLSLSPTIAVSRLVKIIENLPVAARKEWAGAKVREFDFGFSAGTAAPAEWTVPAPAVASMASLNSEIRVTIYPAELDPQ